MEKDYVPDEEDIEVLCKLLSTIGALFDGVGVSAQGQAHATAADRDKNLKKDMERAADNKSHLETYSKRMLEIAHSGKVASRQKFLIVNLTDMRKNGWKARRVELKAKKIADVKKDVKREANQEQQQPRGGGGGQQQGGRGGSGQQQQGGQGRGWGNQGGGNSNGGSKGSPTGGNQGGRGGLS